MPMAAKLSMASRNAPHLKSTTEGGIQLRIQRSRFRRLQLHCAWAKAIQAGQWQCYRRAIRAVRDSGIPFLLGGGFALATYIGRWRNTKDIDFYILPKDRDAAVAALTRAGFEDYYPTVPYDRKWIYRSVCAGVLVDIIWSMANQRAAVDDAWFSAAPRITLRDEPLLVVPVEEFAWCKLYILQRDHCDWTDVFNLLYAVAPRMDWDHLLRRVEDDLLLLKGLLNVYGWLCPARAREVPHRLRTTLGLEDPKPGAAGKRDRVRLLDSRAWFAATLAEGRPLEV